MSRALKYPAPRGLAVLLSLIVSLCGYCSSPAHAQLTPASQTVQLGAGMHVITAEVAATDAARSRGLMFRKELAPNHGMLFIFEQDNVQCFWMRNTVLPLSVAFIQDDGVIANIDDMQPMTDTSHCSSAPVRFVLEMEQGWFAKHGLQAGKKITGLH